MQRVTITLDDDLMADLDRIIAARGYQNRSEAIRDLARSGLEQAAVEVAGSRTCVATPETHSAKKRLRNRVAA